MSGIIGKKIGMTSIYDKNGKNIPCTVIEAGPCVVTQVKSKPTDGYDAIQIAFGEQKEKHTTKAMKGHFAKAGVTPKRMVAEFTRFEEGHTKKFGDILLADIFIEGEFIDVVGISRGRGFQGVIRRHNFGGVGDADPRSARPIKGTWIHWSFFMAITRYERDENGRPDGKSQDKNYQPSDNENSA